MVVASQIIALPELIQLAKAIRAVIRPVEYQELQLIRREMVDRYMCCQFVECVM